MARGTMTATHERDFGFDVHDAGKRYGDVRSPAKLSF
jgi:hypothetical protein